jgi:hypothetical protein
MNHHVFKKILDSSFEELDHYIKINLSSQESSHMPNMFGNSFEEFDHGMNSATTLVTIHPNDAHIPLPKMKKC